MKDYYLERFHWIFRYTRSNFFYCLFKTLCLIVGVPIYAVCFLMEMLFTGINMIFSWIPILNVVVMVICKSFVWLFGSTFYVCILPDVKAYREARKEVNYEVEDEPTLVEASDVPAEEENTPDEPQQTDKEEEN